MDDTSTKTNEYIQGRYMEMSPEQRFLIGIQMFETARTIVISSLPDDISAQDRRRRLYERLYGGSPDTIYPKT